jgi:hypothetical protein
MPGERAVSAALFLFIDRRAPILKAGCLHRSADGPAPPAIQGLRY